MVTANVLIVEDDEIFRETLLDWLTSLGHAAEAATDAGAGLARILESPEKYDLALIDVHLPQISGLEAIEWLRGYENGDARELPIVVMTGDVQVWRSIVKEAHGIAEILLKPISIDDIAAIVASHARKAPARV